MNANLRNFALWVIIVLLLLALFTLFQNPGQRTTSQDISFSQLLNEVDQGRVREVVIQGPEIHGTFNDGRSFQTYAPNDPTLVAHAKTDADLNPVRGRNEFKKLLLGNCYFRVRLIHGNTWTETTNRQANVD